MSFPTITSINWAPLKIVFNDRAAFISKFNTYLDLQEERVDEWNAAGAAVVEWVSKPVGEPISEAAGGDGETYSLLHYYTVGAYQINLEISDGLDAISDARSGALGDISTDRASAIGAIAAAEAAALANLTEFDPDAYVSEAELTAALAGKADASALAAKIDASEKGTADGVATLDSGGKVPSAQLPSYVDDVLEYANYAALPGTGESGKIYILGTPYTSGGITSSQFRWTGSAYAPIVASPGSTDAVTEGTNNLYHTVARVRATTLTGFSDGTATDVTAADTVLSALGKLQARTAAVWANLGAWIAGGSNKSTPADADRFAISDSAASNATKSLTFANLKAALGEMASRARATVEQIRSLVGDVGLTCERIASALGLVSISGASNWTPNWSTFLVADYGGVTANRTINNPTNVIAGTTRYAFVRGSSGTQRTVIFGSYYQGDVPTLADVTSSKWYLLSMVAYSSTHIVITSARAL